MEKQFYLTNDAGIWPARETKRINEERQQFERFIEARANNLGNVVAMLAESRFPGLRKYGDLLGDEIEDLLLKEARLRWVIRVAKYSQAANREELWLEAEREIAVLEKAAEGMLRVECA